MCVILDVLKSFVQGNLSPLVPSKEFTLFTLLVRDHGYQEYFDMDSPKVYSE